MRFRFGNKNLFAKFIFSLMAPLAWGESAAWSLVILYEVEVPGQSTSSFRFRGAGGALLRGLSEWIGRGSSV